MIPSVFRGDFFKGNKMNDTLNYAKKRQELNPALFNIQYSIHPAVTLNLLARSQNLSKSPFASL